MGYSCNLEDRRKLWKLIYAADAFDQARASCQWLIKNKPGNNDPILYTVWTAIHTLYARPFSNNQPVGRLEANIVPEKYKSLHEGLMGGRNKIYAHADGGDLPFLMDQRNEVRFIKKGKQPFWHVEGKILPLVAAKAVEELCGELARKATYRGKRIAERHKKYLLSRQGVYVLNIDDKVDDFLILTNDPAPKSKWDQVW